MDDLIITISIFALALIGLAGSVISLRRNAKEAGAAVDRLHRTLFLVLCVGSLLVFLYREIFVHAKWQPLASHMDGLLLVAVLLGPTAWFLQRHERLSGLTRFLLPVLTILLAWAGCASHWTFAWFDINSTWKVFHLGAVYIGTGCVALGAVAGVMYLIAQRRLQQKTLSLNSGGQPRLASLESIEWLLVLCAMVGFALISLGLITGVILQSTDPTKLGPGWWHTPKVLLAAAAWLTYAILLNAKRITALRGTRAAWLSIFGFVLLLATFAVVMALNKNESVVAVHEWISNTSWRSL